MSQQRGFEKQGMSVNTPDLYGGDVFDDIEVAGKKMLLIGFPEILSRAKAAVEPLPADLVYAGFSMGGAPAEILAAKRPGAKGCLLFHSALPLQAARIESWPSYVPVQVHFAEGDPWRKQEAIDSLAFSVRQSGAVFESFDYQCQGHLFTDADLSDYNQEAAELMWDHVIQFLDKIGIN